MNKKTELKETGYTAKVKVTREYAIGFYSTDPEQALKDVDTIIEDEHFGDNYDDEQVQVIDLKQTEWNKDFMGKNND